MFGINLYFYPFWQKQAGFWKCTTDNACTYRSIKCPFLSGWWKVN
ncbi:hypothetical protein NEIELOOT_02740 [Neisseria elongata subsp. glycolytica ATCC 29315]|uniref:Uncharacterized protein n=1 Tax=Neisseria elongata subsp. glycolytica ATCC 29315 TaxID=546263 RepID=D4DUH8_NEIEG|nr:hypothetical protein NEIELOOT_02740 [Neisseria elongata subsp. glycolytica ATCC 29315]